MYRFFVSSLNFKLFAALEISENFVNKTKITEIKRILLPSVSERYRKKKKKKKADDTAMVKISCF